MGFENSEVGAEREEKRRQKRKREVWSRGERDEDPRSRRELTCSNSLGGGGHNRSDEPGEGRRSPIAPVEEKHRPASQQPGGVWKSGVLPGRRNPKGLQTRSQKRLQELGSLARFGRRRPFGLCLRSLPPRRRCYCCCCCCCLTGDRLLERKAPSGRPACRRRTRAACKEGLARRSPGRLSAQPPARWAKGLRSALGCRQLGKEEEAPVAGR